MLFFISGIILLEELGDLILNHVELSRESLYSILRFLLRYLHRIGVIVWYEDTSVLSDKVFIQPSFLISMFKVSSGFYFPLDKYTCIFTDRKFPKLSNKVAVCHGSQTKFSLSLSLPVNADHCET